jgi:hypothetical protein
VVNYSSWMSSYSDMWTNPPLSALKTCWKMVYYLL